MHHRRLSCVSCVALAQVQHGLEEEEPRRQDGGRGSVDGQPEGPETELDDLFEQEEEKETQFSEDELKLLSRVGSPPPVRTVTPTRTTARAHSVCSGVERPGDRPFVASASSCEAGSAAKLIGIHVQLPLHDFVLLVGLCGFGPGFRWLDRIKLESARM